MQSNPNIVTSVVKAIEILQLFKERDEWGIAEISRKLNFPASSVHRLVSTLEGQGLLFKNARTSRYQLGLELFMIGRKVKIVDLLESKAKPFIVDLAEELNESVHITVLQEGKAVAVLNASSHRHMAAMPYIGQSQGIHATAVGKCLMAYDVDGCRTELMRSQQPLTAYTEKTITDRRILAAEIDRVLQRGFALDDEEVEEGLFCVGTPILNRQNSCIAAMSCSVPQNRYIGNEARIQQSVMDTAAKIREML